jgi:TolB protein
MRRLLALFVLSLVAQPLAGQDTVRTLDDPIRIGVRYDRVRPSLVVLPGAGAGAGVDSARVMVRRDLDYSDRFEMLAGELVSGGGTATDEASTAVNYGIYKSMGAQLGVEIAPESGGVRARLHDINQQKVRNEQSFTLPSETDPNYRLEVHRMADEIARWASGTPGIAATRLLFVSNGRIYRIDSDGEALTPLTPEGQTALSPAWSPDGSRIAYTRLEGGRGGVMLQSLAGGAPQTAPGAQAGLNITPTFSPDGKLLAFARSDESGTDIFVSNVAENCCVQRLTVGRYADNLSPTFSRDGQRIAFVSTRAGPPQIYAMAANGTDQELLVPFNFGATGASNAPEWSPDGLRVVFHRDVSRSPQIFLKELTRDTAQQLTSTGRNEDPTWAPDGRHIAFISDRTGRRQIWIFDIESGRVRQLQTPGAARLPSWSRRMGRAAVATNP